MITRRTSFAAVMAGMFAFLLMAGPAFAEDLIAKFEGTTTKNIAGTPTMMVGATALSNGKNFMVAVPNEEGKKAAAATPASGPNPKKDLAAAIKKLSPGAFVNVSVEISKTLGPTLTGIEAYDIKPGEDSPNGYVFSSTVDMPSGKTTTTMVVLTKFGKKFQFTIANHKNEKGELEPDPEVVAALGKIQENSSVWVQLQGKSIVAVEPYTEPTIGKLGKLGETEIDGHKVPSAEVETDAGKTVTLLVPVKERGKAFVADPAINAELHKVKTGSQVAYRAHEDGNNVWLREIEPAPAKPKAPVEKEMAKKPAK